MLFVDFTWTPVSSPVSFTVGGHSYPYTRQADAVTRASDTRYAAYTTLYNTTLTFTASVTIPPGLAVTSYRWNFGDGVTRHGPVTTHIFRSNPPMAQVSLYVTDSKGGQHHRSKVLNLR